jgi:hypothetical protein
MVAHIQSFMSLVRQLSNCILYRLKESILKATSYIYSVLLA